MAESPPASPRRFPLWETVTILLAIASLWPAYILKLEGAIWQVLSWGMLAVMVAILVRRVVAFQRAHEEVEEERRRKAEAAQQERVRLPWEL